MENTAGSNEELEELDSDQSSNSEQDVEEGTIEEKAPVNTPKGQKRPAPPAIPVSISADALTQPGCPEPAPQIRIVHDKMPQNEGEFKCPSCVYRKDGIPGIVLQKRNQGEILSIQLSLNCGHTCDIIINKNLELVSQTCRDYDIDLDVDKFLEGDAELDTYIGKMAPKHDHAKGDELEHQMLSALQVMNLKFSAKQLSVVIPTKAQLKTEAQIKAEEEKTRQQSELTSTDNVAYLRVMEFEKLAAGHNSYSIEKFCQALKGIDKAVILSFIKKIDNDFLISYDDKTKMVRFYNPSTPEMEILSRAFEKWIRFNRF
jgi:hypothetical protein